MSYTFPIDSAAAIIGGGALAIFALLVAWRGSFSGQAGRLGLFGAAFGIGSMVANLGTGFEAARDMPIADAWLMGTMFGVGAALFIVAILALIGLYRHMAIPLWPTRAVWPMAGLAAALWIGSLLRQYNNDVTTPPGLEAIESLLQLTAVILATSMALASIAAAKVYPEAPGEVRRELGTFAFALGFYPTQFWMSQVPLIVRVETPAQVAGLAIVAAVAAAYIIWNLVAWLRIPATSPSGRGVILLAIMPLIGSLIGLCVRVFLDDSASGIARFVAIAVLGHAILRHNMLGLDAKVRFGISKGTLAALFIAVVFVASEGAQLAFGEDRAWLGLLAGGVLVFALAPLSRMADRLADAAVPRPTAGQGRDLYATLARRLVADGDLSSDDRRTLAHVAQELGLGAGEAHDLLEAAHHGQ